MLVFGSVGGGFKYFSFFTTKIGEMIQFDEHIFSDELVQPPTRSNLGDNFQLIMIHVLIKSGGR